MLEFIFGFLQGYPPSVAVIIFSIIVLFVINIFYKVLIDQNKARTIKQRSKDLNKELKEAQKSRDTEKQKRLMSEMLMENNKLMKQTMRPMLVSMVIVIIFLPSMSTVYGDHIVGVNGTAAVALNGVNHTVSIVDGRPVLGDAVPYEALSSIQPGCDSYCFVAHEGGRYELRTENEKVVVAPIVASLPVALPFIGFTMGWLGWYILCSIPFMVVLRKLMKIYV